MGIDKKREELRQSAEALNEMGAKLARVQAHQKYIEAIPAGERCAGSKLSAVLRRELLQSSGFPARTRMAPSGAARFERPVACR
ncbi:MAG TPA: hypothetical protein VKG21_18475 [Casimicrobiaceae bacterium]|nr:hypothetical protein [Casimicrobiaceae bacterium]